MLARKTLIGLLAATTAALSGIAFADDTAPASTAETQAGATVQGKVWRVFEDTREVYLAKRAKPLAVSPDARIVIDGKNAGIGSLDRGDDIRATLDASGSKVVAIQGTSDPFGSAGY